MKLSTKIAATLLACGSAFAFAEGEMVLSENKSALKLVKIDQQVPVARFVGRETLRGRLYFQFDKIDEHHVDGVLSAKLIPDVRTLSKLPYIKKGIRSGLIEKISIVNTEEALEMMVGRSTALRLSKGTQREVSYDAEIVIDSFIVTTECDTVAYLARAVSIRRPSQHITHVDDSKRFGC